jgi:hypothetical protein
MKKLAILIAVLTLAACETAPTTPVVPNVPLLQEKTEVVIPTGLTAKCPPLTKLDKSSYTQGESLDPLKVWFDQYDLCAGRFEKFVGVVAPALNIKELTPAQPASGVAAQNPSVGQ